MRLGRLFIGACALGACLLSSGAVYATPTAPRIEWKEFRVEPTTLRLGEPFVIHARAVATGVKVGSFLLRTADEVRKDQTIPGLPLYSHGKYYVTQEGKYFLTDNGPLDRDPQPNGFALEVSTQGWKPGAYYFAFFASCRPASGPFVAARHDFAVLVEGDRVVVEDLGASALGRSRAIAAFDVSPTEIEPGEPVTLSLQTGTAAIRGIEVISPYHVAIDETLGGFSYVADEKKSHFGPPGSRVIADNGALDRDRAEGKLVLEIDTHGWPAGAHHLLVNVIGLADRPLDDRSFAVKVVGPGDRLKVTVEPSCDFAPGTHFGKFLPLCDGSLLCADQRSIDGGRTWHAGTGGFGAGGVQRDDGTVLGLQYRCLPEEGEEGWYRVERSVSADGGRSFEKTQARVFVAQAKAAMGHGPHVGPLFMRSIVPRADGSLVGLFAGWFHGDDTPCPYGRGRPYSRSYTCESSDGGRTWRYLATIGYAELGSEGYNEGTMRRLPDGTLLAVLRTGNERDLACQDNPIMWTTSRDDGRTWSPPQRTGVEGAYPGLAVLRDGLVVMSYGRPGAMLVFSADGGHTWTDPTVVDATPYSGYTDVVQIGPGELLVGFGARDYLDPKTGTRASRLRLARVRYQPARR